MKLKLRFERKSFRYTAPVIVGKTYVSSNTALKVTINEETSVSLTSLPHFHQYTIDEWQYSLNDFFESRELSLSHFDLKMPAFGLTPTLLSGELLYIIEAVLFSYLHNKQNHLFPWPEQVVKINGLFSKDIPFERVPDCVKIKIRPGESENCSLAMADCLSKNPAVLFRLDGNRSFDINSLLEFLNKIPQKNIQYIEEPFKNFSDSVLFKKVSSLTLALDESLIPHLEHLQKFNEEFFIVKPSLIGLSKSFELAARYPLRTVLSSSYETASAMKALTSIAATLPGQYHGMDTLKFLPKEFSI